MTLNKEEIINKLNNNNIFIKENIIIDDNNETVTSRIDGTQRKRIYGAYLKKYGLSPTEYKIIFPDAPLYSVNDVKNTSKKSGQHMKTEKYKKIFSEKFKGEKNPNHHTKTTDLERQERSPFSIKFYEKVFKGLDNKTLLNIKNNFIEKALKDRITNNTLEYYILKGYTIEESKTLLKKRQQTFSLNKCIEKYGEIEGKHKWLERQLKWENSLIKSKKLKNGYSGISQDLFDNILKDYINEHIFYATLNHEYILCNYFKYYKYDFVDIKNKKIIEYNGDLYHANPKIFNENDNPHPFKKELKSKDIWDLDNRKISLAKEQGLNNC